MDFIFASAIKSLAVAIIFISYDIACQWFINLNNCISSDWPTNIWPLPTTTLVPAIPKLHELMHQSANHQGFSFNFISSVGLMDGKVPEQI